MLCALSVTLVDNRQIKLLNRRYLKRNRVTDVLAFPLKGKEDVAGDGLLGEIIISVEQALKEARRRKVPPQQEIILYGIHGLLHLLGYDDIKPDDRIRMETRQQSLLRQFCQPV